MSGIWQRLNQSAVFWSWAFNFFRLASGILLLPLLLRLLSEADLGMYYIFLGLVSLVPLIDNAFSFNISRFAGYALGGMTEIRSQGMDATPAEGEPNYPLIWQLLEATRALYFRIACATTLILALVGWLIIRDDVAATSNPQLTWWAALATVVAAGCEILSSWWNAFLRGLDHVRDGARVATIAYAAKLGLACALLVAGFGLAAVPLAGLAAALIQRQLSRRACLKLLPPDSRPATANGPGFILAKAWPNSWRVGLQLLSGYLLFNGASVLCLQYFGLAANAKFGLSWQILMIVQGVATVWTQVAWPKVAQHRARGDNAAIVHELSGRLLRQLATYVVLALGGVLCGQLALDWLGSGKQLLPAPLISLMAVNMFFEMHFSFWTILIATENHVPSLRATVVTNLASLTLCAWLIEFRGLGIEALVAGPLICGGVFNYWHWPRRGAKSVETSWLRFLFGSMIRGKTRQHA